MRETCSQCLRVKEGLAGSFAIPVSGPERSPAGVGLRGDAYENPGLAEPPIDVNIAHPNMYL